MVGSFSISPLHIPFSPFTQCADITNISPQGGRNRANRTDFMSSLKEEKRNSRGANWISDGGSWMSSCIQRGSCLFQALLNWSATVPTSCSAQTATQVCFAFSGKTLRTTTTTVAVTGGMTFYDVAWGWGWGLSQLLWVTSRVQPGQVASQSQDSRDNRSHRGPIWNPQLTLYVMLLGILNRLFKHFIDQIIKSYYKFTD